MDVLSLALSLLSSEDELSVSLCFSDLPAAAFLGVPAPLGVPPAFRGVFPLGVPFFDPFFDPTGVTCVLSLGDCPLVGEV